MRCWPTPPSAPRRPWAATHFGISWPRYRLIGVAELAAAAGILIGLWWHPLGVAAATGMALLLTGRDTEFSVFPSVGVAAFKARG